MLQKTLSQPSGGQCWTLLVHNEPTALLVLALPHGRRQHRFPVSIMAACKTPLTSLTAQVAYFSGFLVCAHQLLWPRHKFEAAVLSLLLLVLVLVLAVTTLN
jgi:hypothetical protein